MLTVCLLFLASAAAIYVACEYFVNGIEWVGWHLRLGATAVGSVLAAFGTALPESAVTFMAVFFGSTQGGKDIGVGAALGGPLVLATVAYAVVGFALRHRAARGAPSARIDADQRRLAHDQSWFMVIFVAKLVLGVLVFSWKPWLALLFLSAYGIYIWRELGAGGASLAGEDIGPLKICPCQSHPSVFRALLQTGVALVVIVVASNEFVRQIGTIALWSGVSPHIAALVLAPVATELPEIMNAIIWVRQGKERLALANISGSMMIQTTIPSAMAIGMTPWLLDTPLLVSGGITLLSVAGLRWAFGHGTVGPNTLARSGALYVAFVIFGLVYFGA
ncbi:MAG: sodium:calcium antiporter [Candidimonas sp.]|nr:MAG: sodium:calcium antiporter [Candidimonas sp.]